MTNYNSSEGKGGGCLLAAMIIGLPILVMGRCQVSNSTISNITVQVDKQQAVPEKGYLFWVTPVQAVQENGKTTYVRTGEQEVIASQKAIFQGKYSSSNIVGEIQDGGVYRMKVNWFRQPLTDSYRNILEVERLDKPADKKTSLRIMADPMQFAIARQRQAQMAL